MAALKSMINDSVEKVKSHPGFAEWCKSQQFGDGDLVAINNSFVFRDVATTKADTYIVLKHGKENFQKEIFVATGLNLKNDFVFFSSKHKALPVINPINEAIEDQISGIGQIVFVLIGGIQDNVVLEENFTRSGFTAIVWNPECKDLLEVSGTKIEIKQPYDEPALWEEFVSRCKKNNITIDKDGTQKDFGVVLDKLQGRAEANLVLPTSTSKGITGITDSIIGALRERKKDYDKALAKCGGKPEKDKDAFNEVLRISYNFSNDVIPLLKLIISICDLKPIILWAAIGEHYALSEAFRVLPWVRSRFKPSLKNYIDTVGDARNSAFHNLFPIRKALKFSLPSDAFQSVEMLIFSEYSPRSTNNKLSYQDKELVDLFLEFTRARQRPVPSDFWKRNVDVMDKVIDLFDATNKVLKELYRITRAK